MQTIKKLAARHCILLAVAVTLFSGCGGPGPRALLQGKKLMEQGKYPQASEKLKTATSLLSTNAQAWNYLGLAYHHGGRAAEAENAYRRALVLDHDLTEAHYNLGCLWLEQNKPEAAKVEFTAYTLRRSNAPEGYIKLGTAQMRCRELLAAERSFSDALRLDQQQVEAWVGVGLVRLERGRPAEAVQYFQSALQRQPTYGPALLNMAIVEQQYLQNRALALRYYREYLALKPTPENAAAVSAVVRQLEQEMNRPARPGMKSSVSQSETEVHLAEASSAETTRTTAASKPGPSPTPAGNASSRPPPAAPEVVQLAAEPELKAAQDVSSQPAASAVSPSSPASAQIESLAAKSPKRGLFQRLLGGNSKPSAPASASAAGSPTGATVVAEMPTFSRYVYRAPVRPAAGDHAEAARAFAQGGQAYQTHQLVEAIQAYRRATQLDPAYFEAYYNLALAATEAGNLTQALGAYEVALAIQPGSSDTRYNFALGLQQANYPLDAANELEKILLTSPSATRTHLALGNLYAQQLRQPVKARAHYLKVLEGDPHNPQAGAIRSWLAEHASDALKR